ncbi:MAG: RNA methyltransferase [Chloroflexi bacterium HGW-Chloroflexi-5]|jgi:tRNA G18 (ribose-2'-O)-methylase SpoU|nr:MAG: RNA methyltransferase [Chloroflexi bacterium HGW-Chloroflexi-5]
MSEQFFQIFECQNPECRLRFPTNLSVDHMEVCPFCKSPLMASGEPYANVKAASLPQFKSARRVDLLLDNLRSTLNVGSIFRTADGAGVNHIYCCGTTPTPDHPKIIKTGLGAEDFVSWSYHRNALDVVGQLEEGTLLYSLEAAEQSIDLFTEVKQIESTQSVLLILGNEISGVDPVLLKQSNMTLSLPMLGSKNSLNVAVAAGIAIYALRFYYSQNS